MINIDGMASGSHRYLTAWVYITTGSRELKITIADFSLLTAKKIVYSICLNINIIFNIISASKSLSKKINFK